MKIPKIWKLKTFTFFLTLSSHFCDEVYHYCLFPERHVSFFPWNLSFEIKCCMDPMQRLRYAGKPLPCSMCHNSIFSCFPTNTAPYLISTLTFKYLHISIFDVIFLIKDLDFKFKFYSSHEKLKAGGF